jgi:hypothetical protein
MMKKLTVTILGTALFTSALFASNMSHHDMQSMKGAMTKELCIKMHKDFAKKDSQSNIKQTNYDRLLEDLNKTAKYSG